ncbi:MAG: S41 family peptidase [Nitrospinota bacterium]
MKYKMMENGIGYLRILSFSQATTREAKAALREFKKQEMKGLVLDLRNNPGGLLKQSVDMSDLFLSGGKVIVSTRGRTDDQNSKFMSHGAGSYTEFPIVVLINAGSASASEIVAGALQDLNRAVIVGTQSFGKGSVQTIRQLSDGAGLSLTTARYYTPSGKMIHGIGIKPDIEVEFEKPKKKDEDEIKPIREKELMRNFNGLPEETKKPEKDSKKEKDLPDRRKIYDLEKDNQLRRAVEVLKTWEIFQAIKLKKAS